MGEVIPVNFKEIKERSGYIIDEDKVEGVYSGDLAAHNDGQICRIGYRGSSEIYNPVEISLEDLNQFCIMWLAIFNPNMIKYDMIKSDIIKCDEDKE